MTQMVPTVSPAQQAVRPKRDRAIDVYRAFALFVVVCWHWVFTIPTWHADGPHVDNPISFHPALGYASWILQVMPLFFIVGGYVTAHGLRDVRTARARLGWTARRVRRLGGPALPLVGALATVYIAARVLGWSAAAKAALLTATPLWFLLSYLGITLLVPIVDPLAKRWPVGHILGLVGLCATWDWARFHGAITGGWRWLSMVTVWLCAHQLGSLLDKFSDRRHAFLLLGGSVAALIACTQLGPYPVSMVGTSRPGISNMGPATFAIIALAGVQLAVVALTRPLVGRLAARYEHQVEWAARLSMPVYLWHMIGFSCVLLAAVGAGVPLPSTPTGSWWLARPVWVLLPLACAAPLISGAYRRQQRSLIGSSATLKGHGIRGDTGS